MNTSTRLDNAGTASFGLLTNALPEAYLLVSPSGRILAQNVQAGRLLGTEVGADLSEAASDPPARLAAYLQKCSGSGALLPGRLTFPDAQGTPVEYRCDGAAVFPSEGSRRIILRLRDHQAASRRFLILNQKIADLTREIHHRAIAEQDLQLQTDLLQENAEELEKTLGELAHQKRLADDANQRKSAFLATMSHELRTPLNAILGYTTLLEHGLDPAGIARIRKATTHLRSIIETILTFASMEAGKEAPAWDDADAVQLANDALELAIPSAQEKGLNISLSAPDETVPVRTDPTRVRQILVNLLSNAVKFTEQGGITVTVARHGEEVRCGVRDTGAGVRAANLERIFEPFWQADEGFDRRWSGTGLGLTVTRELARLLGGDIHVESEPELGSTFSLVLPLRPPVGSDS